MSEGSTGRVGRRTGGVEGGVREGEGADQGEGGTSEAEMVDARRPRMEDFLETAVKRLTCDATGEELFEVRGGEVERLRAKRLELVEAIARLEVLPEERTVDNRRERDVVWGRLLRGLMTAALKGLTKEEPRNFCFSAVKKEVDR